MPRFNTSTGVAPQIDGSLDDAAWQQVKPWALVLLSPRSDQWAATEARVTWDDVHHTWASAAEPAVDKMNVVGVKRRRSGRATMWRS